MKELYKVEMFDEDNTEYKIVYCNQNFNIIKEWDAEKKKDKSKYRADLAMGYYGSSLGLCAVRFSEIVGFDKCGDLRTAVEEIERLCADLKIKMKKYYNIGKNNK